MRGTEKIFAINPGSTSTKIALFEGEELLFKSNVVHDGTEGVLAVWCGARQFDGLGYGCS